MQQPNFKRTKYACYFTYLAMSSAFSLPPLLFASFRELYGISYTLLGTLVLINFCTQLTVDLIFSFFSKYFNIHLTLRLMPLLTSAGFCIYALFPLLFPEYAYVGLLLGTFIFSISSGLCEVLVSPVVAALPSKAPEKDMSVLHSLYAYGFVTVVLISTLFLHLAGNEYWYLLTLAWALLPIAASIILMLSPLPDLSTESKDEACTNTKRYTKSILLCMLCIFLGACTENTMSNWISVYVENGLQMPKLWGDILGLALFAILLGLTRTAYAKFGKNILRVLMVSMLASVVCYLVVAASPNMTLSLIACALVGITSSMLWPGTLILMEEKLPAVGVAAYALMAAGGDFGASVAPQAMGIVVDRISLTAWAQTASEALSITPEQFGFKIGMLLVAVFPLLGFLLLLYMKRYFKKSEQQTKNNT